jgi:hypothetical protein
MTTTPTEAVNMTAPKAKKAAPKAKKKRVVQQRTTKCNGKKVVVLPPALQLAVNAGILQAAKDNKIALGGMTIFYLDVEAHYNGNKKLRPKTQHTYIQHYRQLWRHLAQTGDFESMLLLVSPRLTNLPAMKVESLQSFVRRKKMPPTAPLRETEDGVPLLHCVTNEILYCEGTWASNMKMKQFTSAVSRLHAAHKHTSHYDNLCSGCVDSVARNENSRGCRQHAGSSARIFRRGDPTKDQDFLDVKDALVDGNYTVRGCDALSPKDVRAIRKKLLAGNSIAMLGAYTLILIAIRIFLRSDEVLTIEMAHFIPECFVRSENRIRGLCVKVWGKTDKRWKYYWLWVNDECPEFCPVRHLFVYLHLSGIKSGYLFPPWQDITGTGAAPPADGHHESHLSYSTFSKWFNRMLQSVLPNEGAAFRTGLHMFRKTGYKFAIWGKGEWEAIMVDARHVSEADAKLYAGDSWSSQHLADIFDDPENVVNQYKPSFCRSPRLSALDNVLSTAAGVELSKLTQEFITELPIAAVVRTDQRSLLDAAMNQTHTKPASDLFKELESTMNAQQKLLLKEAMHQIAAEERFRNQVAATGVVSDETPAPTLFPPAKKVAAATGTNDLVGRELVANFMTLEEKVAKIKELEVGVPVSLKELTGAAQIFVKRTIRPVSRCIANHFSGDVADFISFWRSSFKIKFSAACCSGNGKGPCCVGAK